jgi:hypothetical protein
VLIARYSQINDVIDSFQCCDADRLLKVFLAEGSPLLLFETTVQLSVENLSFFYVVFRLQPQFLDVILTRRLSNLFLFHVLRISAAATKQGYSAIVRLVLATLRLILDNQEAIARLCDPCASAFRSDIAPEQDTYANFLLEVLTFLCQSPELLPSVFSVFLPVCPSLPAASVTTAARVIGGFEGVIGQHANLVPFLLETFAAIGQRRRAPENGFATAIFLRASLFRRLPESLPKSRQALEVILAFVSIAKATAKAAQKTALERDELAQLLASFDLENAFPLTQNFISRARPPPANPFWSKVADDMLHVIFACEVARLQPKPRQEGMPGSHRRDYRSSETAQERAPV